MKTWVRLVLQCTVTLLTAIGMAEDHAQRQGGVVALLLARTVTSC